jgi:NAD(P)-dependent dehydrogenase (short-subunit alcohol dehydrogenase family)
MIDSRIPRLALVTGASRRIGRASALHLASLGFAVAIHYEHSHDDAEEVVREIKAMGGHAQAFQADLSDERQTQGLGPLVSAALGPIGVLVNNASTFERDSVQTADRAHWDLHMEVNLRAPFVLTQHVARTRPQDARAVIVNLLDQRVWNLTPHFTTYTLSKAGLWTLTQTLALALAPHIRVAGIGPGPALPSVRQTQEHFDRQLARTPLGCGTSPDEIARAIQYVIETSSFTGQMIGLYNTS